MKAKCILVVDDEVSIQRTLHRHLQMNGYEVLIAGDGERAIEYVRQRQPDLIVLDIGLPPPINGLDVCKQVRKWVQTPIIILSAINQGQQKIEALDAGADDYLTKPFDMGELQARVRTCLRRASLLESSGSGANAVGMVKYLRSEDGYLRMDVAGRQVHAGEQEVRLTPTEFELLFQLMLCAGKVLTHRSLLRAVWGPEYGEEADYLRVYVRQLRIKVEVIPSRPRYIVTEPGIGYVFRENVIVQNI
jgi:two-component system, OmpR family, KDP operon response regulator KdpE